MSAIVPLIAGAVAGGLASKSMVSRSSTKRKNRATRKKTTQVVVYDPKFAASQTLRLRTGRRSRATARRNRRGVTQRPSKELPANSLGVSPLPVSINMGAGTTTWRIAGVPQPMADYDNTRGIRIVGSCIGPSTLYRSASTLGFPGLLGGFPNVDASFDNAPITPGNLDGRLQLLEKCFSFYAFRKLIITYVPQNSPNANNVSNQQVFIGVDDNSDESLGETYTKALIMELEPSMMVQSTATQSMTYTHRGTKLFVCSSYGETDALEYAQLSLVAQSSDTTTVTGAQQNYGTLHFQYVLDLYRPTAVQVQPSVDVKDSKQHSLAEHGIHCDASLKKGKVDDTKLEAAYQLLKDVAKDLSSVAPPGDKGEGKDGKTLPSSDVKMKDFITDLKRKLEPLGFDKPSLSITHTDWVNVPDPPLLKLKRSG
jgi:hypothetical protein